MTRRSITKYIVLSHLVGDSTYHSTINMVVRVPLIPVLANHCVALRASDIYRPLYYS